MLTHYSPCKVPTQRASQGSLLPIPEDDLKCSCARLGLEGERQLQIFTILWIISRDPKRPTRTLNSLGCCTSQPPLAEIHLFLASSLYISFNIIVQNIFPFHFKPDLIFISSSLPSQLNWKLCNSFFFFSFFFCNSFKFFLKHSYISL